MRHNQRVFIMSAERPNYSAVENSMRADRLFYEIERLGLLVDSAIGSYEGATEVSAVVIERSGEDLRDLLLNLANTYDQDCILMRESSGSSYLISKDWKRDDYVGEFRAVPEPVAKLNKSWTRSNGTYYITQNFETK